MAITAATRTSIIQLVTTAYNAAPGTTLLTELVAIVDGGGTLADVATNLTTSSTWTSLYPTFQTAEEFADAWLAKLVPEASAEALAEGKTVVTGLINGGSSFADIITQAQTYLAGLAETDASFGTSAANFNNKVEVAEHFTVTQGQDGDLGALQSALANVTSDDATVATAKGEIDSGATSAGTTTTLTTSVDTISGTSGDDVIKGVVSSNTGQTTLGAGDDINGQVGTDALEIIFDGTGDFGPVATVANVENFFLKNFGTAANTANLANITGIAQVWNDGSLQNVDVTNLSSLATIGVRNTVTDTDITFTNAALTGDSAVTVLLDGVNNTATDVTLGATSGSEGVETVTVMSSGSAANRLNTLNSDQADFTTLNITGTQALTLDSVDDTLTKIDASGLEAALTATISAATTGKDVSFIGTKMNDKITVGTTTQSDTIDGGDGTDALTASGTFGATVSNVESLTLLVSGTDQAASADLDKAQSITSIAVGSLGSTATFNKLNFTNLPANPTIALSSNGASDIDLAGAISLKTATGSADNLTLAFSGNGSFEFSDNATAKTFEGIETITIAATSAGDIKNTDDVDLFQQATDVLTKVVITGTSKIDLDETLSATTAAFELDASALTGVLDMAKAVTGGAITLKGGSGNDILFGGASADTITTGGGNNTVTAAAGNDTVTGGSGNDQITGGTGADTINGGAGTDTYNYADGDSLLASNDIISGFSASTDTFVLGTNTGAALVTLTAALPGNAAANTVYVTRGDYASSGSGTFTISATGADVQVLFETDGAGDSAPEEEIALLGAGASIATITAADFT